MLMYSEAWAATADRNELGGELMIPGAAASGSRDRPFTAKGRFLLSNVGTRRLTCSAGATCQRGAVGCGRHRVLAWLCREDTVEGQVAWHHTHPRFRASYQNSGVGRTSSKGQGSSFLLR